MKPTLLLSAIATASIGLTGCQSLMAAGSAVDSSTNNNVSKSDGVRQVNQVIWDKTGGTFSVPSTNNLSTNESRLIFVRGYDEDPLQTSVNIGIDDRFQVSLQPGQYSEVVTCNGQHNVSAQITGLKNNVLKDAALNQTLTAQRNHYYMVVVDAAGQPNIGAISQDQALAVLNNPEHEALEQTHQISRVVPTCNTPPVATTPVTPAPVIVQPKPPVEINTPIKLDVLFDFDSASVKPNYYKRIENMAQFMQANTNMTAVLEGHTDSKGPASYNLRLSQARAAAVKDYLVNKYGADGDRITTVGYGESRPVDTNDTAQGRQNNRRVVAIIDQK